MRRLSFLSLAALLAIATAAAGFAVASIAADRMMGWHGLWVFLASHRAYPITFFVVLFNNCVVVPLAVTHGRRAKQEEEDGTVKPLLRWQNGIGRRGP